MQTGQQTLPAQQQPQTPYGLALQPPNPPRISFVGGELTVIADNSSLAEIVTGIERAIGAHLEGNQPDAERVFGQFGPGSPREVLNSLLSGSRYDFILTGAIDDPGGVQTIILSQHGGSPAGSSIAGNQPATRPNIPENADEDNDEGVAIQQTIPEPPQQTPNVPSEQSQPPQQGQQSQQQVKTPEQLLQELQRLRQQQQQQQPPATNPR